MVVYAGAGFDHGIIPSVSHGRYFIGDVQIEHPKIDWSKVKFDKKH